VRVRSTIRGILIVSGLTTAIVAASAQPAAAHSVGDVEPSNYDTSITAVTPQVRGLSVSVVDLGNELELRNETGEDVVVPGYQGEPYLSVGPRGVFENRRSPAAYLNRTRDGKTPVPARADPAAPPEWRKTASGTTARWHDHRAHWMGTDDPQQVARDPGRRHVIDRWRFELRRGSDLITVSGDLVWVPGPSPWGWILGAFAAAIALVAASRTRFWRWALAGALAVVVVSEVAHVIGPWIATTSSFSTKLSASVYSVGGIALAAVALVWIVVRPPWNAVPAVLFAGLVVLAAGGLADLSTLTRSQLPTDLPNVIARLQVVVALGLGAGLAVAAALRLRPPPTATMAYRERRVAEPMNVP
jgi:hypothetical protein